MSKRNISGIYVIINTINNKIYVGKSKSVNYRWRQNHLPQLRLGIHGNRHLQSAWNKNGESKFSFFVIEECEKSMLLEREGYWIEYYKSWDRNFGYNFTRIIDGKQILSEEVKNKISSTKQLKALTKKYWTTGTNGKILKMYKLHKNKSKIARELKITRSEVYSCLKQNGLHKNNGKAAFVKLTPQVKKEITNLRKQGITWANIIINFGVSKTQLYRALQIKDGCYGGQNVKRKTYIKLTPKLRRRAIKLRDAGKSWKDIALILNVNRAIFYQRGLAKNQKNLVRKEMTNESKKEIIKLKNEGYSWKEISKTTGFSYSSIHRHNLHKPCK